MLVMKTLVETVATQFTRMLLKVAFRQAYILCMPVGDLPEEVEKQNKMKKT